MVDDLRTDLDQLFLEAGQRPVLDRLGRRQRAQEVAEVIGQGVKLETHGIRSVAGILREVRANVDLRRRALA